MRISLCTVAFAFASLMPFGFVIAAETTGCAPFAQGTANVPPEGGRVTGALAPFNPCHPSVSFETPGLFAPKLGEKPPVMVIIHGGSGLENYQTSTAKVWQKEGFSTLVFDAFQMNGLDPKSPLVRYRLASSSKQKMIFTVTMGAYQWLLKNERIDASRIFFQGLSQGGHVAINIAGAVDPSNVRGVIAESAPPYGIGFPDHIKTPLVLTYGERDKYGTENELMYKIKAPCRQGEVFSDAPPGYGQVCHRSPGLNDQRTPSPLEWLEKMKSANEPVTLLLVKGGGHGPLFDNYKEETRQVGNGMTFHTTQGADPDARAQAWTALIAFVKARL